MPDTLAQALAMPGLGWLSVTIAIAGLVRGFTGFGTALIVVPVAGIFLAPHEVIVVIALTGIASTFVLLPRAFRQADSADVSVLILAALVMAPLGFWLMARLDDVLVRWCVAIVAGGTLLALVTGWRYAGRVTRNKLVPVGGAAGIIGGMTGLTGPAVILFYLTGQATAQTIRANTILFLAGLDVVLLANLFFRDLVTGALIFYAALLAVPYFITSLIGQALFHPDYERSYRALAYSVIALAVVTGLPVWEPA
ncbi:MAG: sulfite exporter TauE/SafE family protein [Pseudomonadota bacterium]